MPVKDDTADLASKNRTVHKPISELQNQVQPTGQVAAESVNSFEVEADQGEEEMVSKRTLTFKRFLLDAHPIV